MYSVVRHLVRNVDVSYRRGCNSFSLSPEKFDVIHCNC